MMDANRLQDRIAKGCGLAARKIGCQVSVYRPGCIPRPIDERNLVIRLSAAFVPPASGVGQGDQPIWRGIFDSYYTRPGDYLVGDVTTFFVGEQVAALPILCVATNRAVTIVRPSFVSQGGYSGLYASNGEAVIEAWPASILARGSSTGIVRPGGEQSAGWLVLLPNLPATPRMADVVTDDLGASYCVETAEQYRLGWRLSVTQVGA